MIGRWVVILIGIWWVLTTATRVEVWGDEPAVWAEAVAHSPAKPRPWINYGRMRPTLEAQAEAFTRARQLAPGRAWLEGPMRGGDVATLDLAIVRAEQGRYDEALALTATIGHRRPRADGGSIVDVLETTWHAERTSPPSSGF